MTATEYRDGIKSDTEVERSDTTEKWKPIRRDRLEGWHRALAAQTISLKNMEAVIKSGNLSPSAMVKSVVRIRTKLEGVERAVRQEYDDRGNA